MTSDRLGDKVLEIVEVGPSGVRSPVIPVPGFISFSIKIPQHKQASSCDKAKVVDAKKKVVDAEGFRILSQLWH